MYDRRGRAIVTEAGDSDKWWTAGQIDPGGGGTYTRVDAPSGSTASSVVNSVWIRHAAGALAVLPQVTLYVAENTAPTVVVVPVIPLTVPVAGGDQFTWGSTGGGLGLPSADYGLYLKITAGAPAWDGVINVLALGFYTPPNVDVERLG